MGRNKFINILLLVIMLAVVLIGFLSICTATTLIRINTTEDKLRKTLVQREQTIGRQRAEIDILKQELTEQRNIVKDLKDNSTKQANIVLNAVRSRSKLKAVKDLPGYNDLSRKQKLAIMWLLDPSTSKENDNNGKFYGDQNYDYDVMTARKIDKVRNRYLGENGRLIKNLQSLDECYDEIMDILSWSNPGKRVF